MSLIYLVEATAWDIAASAEVTLRWCSGDGYVTGPGETPANTVFAPRLLEPINYERHAWSSGTTSGESRVGAGLIELANPDGELDGLVGDYALDGRALRVLIGQDSAPYADFQPLLTGTMEQPEVTSTRARIRIRDRARLLDEPIQTATYAGTSTGSTGLEGGDDVRGRPKPLTYGVARNVSAVLVNASLLAFQVHDGPVQDVTAVYVRGAAITKGADYTSQSQLESSAPSTGTYRVWPGGGMFRLGSQPDGQVTADVGGDAAGGNYVSAVPAIVERIITTRGGLTADDIGVSVGSLASSLTQPVGAHISGGGPIRQTLDDLCASLGLYWYFDQQGAFQLGRLEAPAGAPALTLQTFGGRGIVAEPDSADVLSLERQSSRDEGNGLPAWRVTVGYRRNWTVQSPGDLAGAVSEARKSTVSRDMLTTAPADDTSVQAVHLLATELRRDTLLDAAADAEVERDRLAGIYGVRRDRYRVRVQLSGDVAAVDLGSVVRLQVPRFGLDGGKLMTVTGVVYDARRSILELDLWG